MAEGGEFALLDVIGCGGHGTVHRAQFIGEGGFRKEVAIKLLKSNVRDDPELDLRLRDEGRILGLLHHRAIVGVDRLTRIEGRWAVVMEYVQGEDLSALIARGPMPTSVALAISAEIASAIGAAYSTLGHDGRPLRLLHRDLKPSNVRISPDGSVKVLDFGIARAEFTHREADTRSRTFGGTDLYMAPERLDGVADSPAGDVYSVGAILAEMLRGERVGKAYGKPQRHARLCRATLDSLRALGVPSGVVSLTGELLAYEPAARPDIAEVERRAEELARGAEGPSLKRWATQHIRVAALPPPSAPLDTDGLLRSGAILQEGDVATAEGTRWITGTDRLVQKYLDARPETPPPTQTPTTPPGPPPVTLKLPQRPETPPRAPTPPPPIGDTLEGRPPPSIGPRVALAGAAGHGGNRAPLRTTPRPSTRQRLIVPILATVIIALSLMVATIITLIGRGGEDEPGPGPGEAAGGNIGDLSQLPPEPPEPPIGTILCAPDGDADGHGAKDGASPQPGELCPAGWVTLIDDCDDARPGVAPGKPESCDGRDNDCDGRADEGFEDRNSNGQLDCAESAPAFGINAHDRSRWLRSGLVLEAKIPKGCAPRARVRLDGAGSWRSVPKEITVENGHARCGVPIAGAASPEGAPLCGLPALSAVDLSSESAQIEWRCCYEGPKSKAGQGQRDACHVVGGNVVTQQM
ncbi:MAG: protein kinase [Deltaproteobacteria bacterium]|nr:protein kinase [Deltaproteobacteria bacterium]